MTKLIPFERELYEKGLSVVRRDGLKVLQLFFIDDDRANKTIFQVYRLTPLVLSSAENLPNGMYKVDKESIHDLFLERETIDLWIGLNHEIITFPNGHRGIQCMTYAYCYEHGIPDDMLKVKISLDAETLEQEL